jgi:hypothetical protein
MMEIGPSWQPIGPRPISQDHRHDSPFQTGKNTDVRQKKQLFPKGGIFKNIKRIRRRNGLPGRHPRIPEKTKKTGGPSSRRPLKPVYLSIGS